MRLRHDEFGIVNNTGVCVSRSVVSKELDRDMMSFGLSVAQACCTIIQNTQEMKENDF